MEDWVSTYSINDALVTLTTIGLEKMAEIVQANLDKATREQEAYAETMAFFLESPPKRLTFLSGRPPRP